MNNKAILFFSLLALGFSAAFTSCLPDTDDNKPSTSTLANVMVVNAISGGASLDFYVADELQNSTGVWYGTNTPYYQTTTGNTNLKLNKNQSAVNYIDRDEDLDLSGNYTLIGMDTMGSVSSVFLSDDLSEPVLGKSHIRFVHASHNTSSIDIVNLADTTILFGNRGFRQHSAFTAMDAGSYALGYRLLGDSNITSLPQVNLGNQEIYTMVISGFNTDTSGTAVSSLNVNMISNK